MSTLEVAVAVGAITSHGSVTWLTVHERASCYHAGRDDRDKNLRSGPAPSMSELEPGPSTSSVPGGEDGPKPRMPRHRLWSLAMLGLAVVVAGMATVYLFASGGSASPKFGSSGLTNLSGAPTPIPNTGVLDAARPEVGKPVPNFALADARNPGHVLKLSDFAGKPIVLNFYASW